MAVASDPVDPDAGIDLGGVFAGSYPIQDNETEQQGREAEISRGMRFDLQRTGAMVTFYVAGQPDSVALTPLLQAFKMGELHPWADKPRLSDPYASMFVVNVQIDPWVSGASPPDSTDYNTYELTHAWSRVTVTYRQRCDPGGYEEHRRTSLISRGEWYSYLNTPEFGNVVRGYLSGDQRAIPILHRVPILTRHWPKVQLSKGSLTAINNAIGRLNPEEFAGHVQAVWMLDGADVDLLYRTQSGPSEEGYYEVTLVFRGDPVRKHQYWLPITDETFRPIFNPNVSYENHHVRKDLYQLATVPFDELVPCIWHGHSPGNASRFPRNPRP